MKILQACPYAWDAPGGVQVHVRELTDHLRERGHDVLVVAPSLRPLREEGVLVAGRAVRIRYQGTVAPICFTPGSLVRVGGALRSFEPDVVHVHEPLTPSTSMVTTIRSRVPVIATFHAFAERSTLLDVAAPVLRAVWRKLSARVAVSNAAASFMGSRFGDGIRIVPNGVDVDEFRVAPPADLPPGRRMLWVGRLDRQKGFPVAVRAFAELAPEFPDLSLVVAGDGRERGAASELEPDVRSRVQMLGPVPHRELPAYLAAADVFVAPALGQESFGIVLVEAMAAGVPVVASAIAGYDEVVRDGVDGILVPPNDPHALAVAIGQVLTDPERARRLGESGRERAAEFSWDEVTSRLETIYEQTQL